MSALIGTWALGTQPLWPPASVSVQQFFDRPAWERPSGDNPYTAPSGTGETFSGAPGWAGGAPDTATGPGFTGGFWEFTTWIEGDPDDRDDGGQVRQVGSGGGVTVVNITAARRKFYSIEVYDTDGDMVTRVPGWTSGKLRRRMDTASELEFTIPLGAEGASDLVRPNTVWLRDRWGFVEDTFQIAKRKPRGRGDASHFVITCQGAISQLSEEVVLEYAGAELPVLDHVVALMDLQQRGDALTLGTVDAAIGDIELPFFAADTNIHAALLSLQMALPKEQRGRLYVDPQRRLQWRLVVGDQTEQVITRQRNVMAIDAETDYTRLINRVYMYGEGLDPDTRLTLLDASEPELYVEDTDSQTAYGLRAFQKQDRRIRNPETLLRVANRILEEFSTPPTTVTVELLDLAKADDAPAGWQDIYIGGKYRVVDSDLGLDSSIEIVSIETDLAKPVPLRVDLTNQVRDLSDLIARLVDSLQQPLYVDGDRYPTMGRNYSGGVTADTLRAGDTRWNSGDDRGEMHDGSDWREMGGGISIDDVWEVKSSKASLSAASGVAVTLLGRIDGGGSDNGMVCVVNPAKSGWDAINFWE